MHDHPPTAGSQRWALDSCAWPLPPQNLSDFDLQSSQTNHAESAIVLGLDLMQAVSRLQPAGGATGIKVRVWWANAQQLVSELETKAKTTQHPPSAWFVLLHCSYPALAVCR